MEKLTAPKINNNTLNSLGNLTFGKDDDIFDKRVCLRPGNKAMAPKVHVEFKEGKTIACNYGHMGVGYTLAPGSSEMAIANLEQAVPSLSKDEPITVVGAGFVGLVNALLLAEKGYSRVTVVAEYISDLTSFNAGAIFSAASVIGAVNKKAAEILDKSTKGSLAFYKRVLEGKSPLKNYSKSIRYLDQYFGAEKEFNTIFTHSGLESLVEEGLVGKPEEVELNFTETGMKCKKYSNLYFNSPALMAELLKTVKSLGIQLKLRKISSYSDIDDKVVFCCAGLGARKLNGDPDIYPVAGHLLLLKKQPLQDYVIYTHFIDEEKKGKVKYEDSTLLYYMPRSDGRYFGILGGSLIHDYAGGDAELNNKMYNEILRVAKKVFGFDKLRTKAKF